nr:immunoglobulin heavy chain junction region [Macaca mulatta]
CASGGLTAAGPDSW